ncbi:hypothetical protein Cgig2_001614 [Carnegiea gigantea]|uniref:Uncharacterized protein n=1 Tax=Carnegiea gigantea TaxID=171969 RepID=A0A9Q1GRK2_9CARY|nr:hypothetical protein Cgig2_001614 [Carnegiea gigantea]
MYQKAFIMRMTIHSFSSMLAQLNEAQTKVVRSMGFASFLKVDLKQIPGKFSKLLVESSDPYSASFVLPNGQRFTVAAFDVYMTLGMPIGERETMEITRSLTVEEYDENHYYNKSILKYVKNVNQTSSLDWCKFVLQKLITLAQLNEAQADAVRSIGFASFLKVDMKQIPGKFSKHLDGQKFLVIKFDMYVTLGVPSRGREIIKVAKSFIYEEYDEVHTAWLKEWKIEQNAPELTRMPEFILAKKNGGESFKRNFIIYLVNCFFSGPKNCYYSKSIPKYVNNVSQIASLDWTKEATTMVLLHSARHFHFTNQIVKIKFREPHWLQMPKGSPRVDGDQQATDSNKPKLTKEVLPEKDDEKRLENLSLACCSSYVIRLTKLDRELSQDELVISEYVFGKVKDETTTVCMANLKPGAEVEMNVINIWSNTLNDRERKRDLATPSRLFMSLTQIQKLHPETL